MQKYESIERGILQNDVKALRESIGSICYTCRDFSNGEFDEVVEYVLSKGIKLMDDTLVGELVSTGKESYTDEDFARAIFELKKNFCKERIADVKKIGATLYRKKEEPKPQTVGTGPNAQSHQASNNAKLKVAGLVAAGLAVVAVAVILVILFKK
ncbi:MAG: hypothetical protein E7602_00075 [Ruminococcaceae bacterium]|nr:hypothetical protein [Oscillospiraceae bacterium]